MAAAPWTSLLAILAVVFVLSLIIPYRFQQQINAAADHEYEDSQRHYRHHPAQHRYDDHYDDDGADEDVSFGDDVTEDGYVIVRNKNAEKFSHTPSPGDSKAHSMLVLQWPESLCASERKGCNSNPIHNYFTLHGVWPIARHRVHCRSDYDLRRLRSMEKNLTEVWPSYFKQSKSQFWKHEYEKHGSCLFADIETYFEHALTLHNSYPLLDILSPNPEKMLPLTYYIQAIEQKYHVKPMVMCRKNWLTRKAKFNTRHVAPPMTADQIQAGYEGEDEDDDAEYDNDGGVDEMRMEQDYSSASRRNRGNRQHGGKKHKNNRRRRRNGNRNKKKRGNRGNRRNQNRRRNNNRRGKSLMDASLGDGDGSRNSLQLLVEVGLCFNAKHQLVDCPKNGRNRRCSLHRLTLLPSAGTFTN